MITRRAFTGILAAVLPDRRIDQRRQPISGTMAPGSASGTVRARLVIVSGPRNGVFVYSGTPALGNLFETVTASGGTDPYGNAYLAGTTTYRTSGGTYYAIQQGATAVNWYTAPAVSGPYTAVARIQFDATNNALWLNARAIGHSSLSLSPAEYLYLPSADTSGATDTAAINGFLTAGNPVRLIPGAVYYITAPLVFKSESRLFSPAWDFASNNDGYSAGPGAVGGAKIVMVPGFAGDAALSLPDPGAGVQNYGVDISGITIEGSSVAAGTIYGLHATGAWGACNLRGVMIHRPPADCFRWDIGATGAICDEWVIDHCKASASRNGYGFYMHDLADSVISHCNGSQNQLDNWLVNYGTNTRLVDCKGENSKAGNGFHFTGIAASEAQHLIGCSTHVNQLDGFLFDNSGPSGGALGTYLLDGCVSVGDGVGGSVTSAGFKSLGCLARVMASGCTTIPAATTKYGAYEGTVSFGMCFTGSRLDGVTAATLDDATNTHALVNQSPVPF